MNPRFRTRPAPPSMVSFYRFGGALVVCLGLLGAFLGGCDAPPASDPSVEPGPPRLALGPILAEESDGRVAARFTTNKLCVPGFHQTSGAVKRTIRAGYRTTDHVVRLTPPTGAQRQTYRLFLDDAPGPSVQIKRRPAPGEAVVLGILAPPGPDTSDHDRVRELAARVDEAAPDALLLTGGPLPAVSATAAWRDGFFQSLGPALRGAPLWVLPEDEPRLPAHLGQLGGGAIDGYWSRTLGCVEVLGVEVEKLRSKRARRGVVGWLKERLSPDLPAGTWRVLVLAQAPFHDGGVDAEALDALGTLLEHGNVDLVLGGGGAGYQRSLPLVVEKVGATVYISINGRSRMGASGEPIFAARASGAPVAGLLTASPERLSFRAIDAGGATVDELVILGDRYHSIESDDPPMAKGDVTSEAMARLLLKSEVLRVARQAARAVADPTTVRDLTFTIANPSPLPMRGALRWEIPPGTAWRVSPTHRDFELAAGYQGKARFRLEPGQPDGPAPVLTVSIDGVGERTQELILAKRKVQPIRPLAAAVRIDGQPGDPAWAEAERLSGFVRLDGGEPTRPIDARVAYNDTGILLLVDLPAADANRRATKSVRHDDPVYEDESIEIFVDPRGEGRDYYQFGVNVRGIKLDRSSRLGLAWNPSWSRRIQTRKDRYAVELIIPYSALGLAERPKPGTEWAFNLTRNDYQGSYEVGDAPELKLEDPDPIKPFDTTDTIDIENIDKELDRLERERGPGGRGPRKRKAREREGEDEIVQWAPTYGSNGRSGLYGILRFEPPKPKPQPGQPAAPAPPSERGDAKGGAEAMPPPPR